MIQKFDDINHWIVIFNPRKENKRWWHPFVNNRFNHVVMLYDIPDVGTVVMEALEWGIAVRFEPHSIEKCIEYYGSDATAIVSYISNHAYNVDPIPRGIYTCVSMCKAFLGLRKCFFVITPFQLYKFLLKQNSVVLKYYVPYNDIKL